MENIMTGAEKIQLELDAANKHYKAHYLGIDVATDFVVHLKVDDSEWIQLKGNNLQIIVEPFSFNGERVTLPIATFSPIN